jgi:hypothetical protein
MSHTVWRKDLPFRVAEYSAWRERGRPATNWKVTARFYFELGNARHVRAIRVHCFEGEAPGIVLHMSEDRFLRRFVPMFPGSLVRG